MADQRLFHGPNAGYVLEIHERFLADPASVEAGWRDFFSRPGFDPAALEGPAAVPATAAAPATGAPAPAAGFDVGKVLAARELARAIRGRGHTAARLDPLGGTPEADPALDPATHGITEAELEHVPAAAIRNPPAGTANAREAISRLREIYSGTTGYEFLHLPDSRERGWLREAIESGRFFHPLPAERRRALLQRLSQVEGFERYLHRAFFGQKRFSIEGTDLMVPMLDEMIAEAGAAGARDVVIGMAHRGRLNVLTHVLGKPYAMMLAGFQGAKKAPGVDDAQNSDEPSGDVKYHMGWQTRTATAGGEVRVTLSANPSHLEFVGSVVVGMTRAAQDDTGRPGPPALDPKAALAVLIHGDAAFPGQGVVPETFNMSQLPGYTVGGTLHIIANNQVGFTTNPRQSRSTRYSSDIAKGFEVPVVHVNADDAEACLAVSRMAAAYRAEFGKDFVIDLVGYRRWGHNEGDEPTFTQPVMYEAIRSHPTAREALAARLVEEGVLSQADADALLQGVLDELGRVLESLSGDAGHAAAPHGHGEAPSPNGRAAGGTAVDEQALRAFNEALLARPEGFTPHADLDRKVLQKRGPALDQGKIDWGHAEALGFASLLADGVAIRLTGQDVERGTFSHRHAVLNDARTGEKLNLFHTLPQAKASLEIHNSPLTEMAVVGFEYGYTMADPRALVIWEAQFGDFANGAQVMIDQYLAASEQKWGQRSGMVLLLPHGYEGQGPEHSSARLERWLQLSAEDNFRVVYPTTAAQYFHLLRRQAALLESDARPLVVMSPKSLLRHPLASARLEQLSGGAFHPVLADEGAAGREERVTRLVLCSGKVYVDLFPQGDEQKAALEGIEGRDRVAVARVEELYPFPADALRAMIAGFPALREIVWVQEEPRNMGAWSFAAPRLAEVAGELPVRYVGRPDRASPAEGYAHRHVERQARIVREAWSGAPEPGGGEGGIGARLKGMLDAALAPSGEGDATAERAAPPAEEPATEKLIGKRKY